VLLATTRHTGPVTDNPEQAERAEPEPELLRRPLQQIEFQAKRTQKRLGRMTDAQLIGEVDTSPAPAFVNPMELNRRLKVSIEDLTTAVKAARRSSDRLGWILVGLTILLVVLTVALVVLTIKLTNGAH
jgi:hypothetical protein